MANILVIDDALVMRKGITKILAGLGHTVVGEGKSGEEAIAKYKDLKPDVVMMDITMDGMDGITATKNIIAEFPSAKIVMCSSHANSETKEDALKSGAVGYVTKPFVEADVANAIVDALK